MGKQIKFEHIDGQASLLIHYTENIYQKSIYIRNSRLYVRYSYCKRANDDERIFELDEVQSFVTSMTIKISYLLWLRLTQTLNIFFYRGKKIRNSNESDVLRPERSESHESLELEFLFSSRGGYNVDTYKNRFLQETNSSMCYIIFQKINKGDSLRRISSLRVNISFKTHFSETS